MMENGPEIFAKTRLIINPKDYIRFRMTGELFTDVSDASGYGFFNTQERAWCGTILDAGRIPQSIFPRVLESTEVAGTVHASAAEEMGVAEGIPVVAGGGDAVVQPLGSGAVTNGRYT